MYISPHSLRPTGGAGMAHAPTDEADYATVHKTARGPAFASPTPETRLHSRGLVPYDGCPAVRPEHLLQLDPEYGQTLQHELESHVETPNARPNATPIPLGSLGGREALVFQPLVPSRSQMHPDTPRGLATLLSGFLQQQVSDVVMIQNPSNGGRPQQMLDRAFQLKDFDPAAKVSWQAMDSDGKQPSLVQVTAERVTQPPHVAEMRLHRLALGDDVASLAQQLKAIHQASAHGTIAIGCNSGQRESGAVAVLLHQRETARTLQSEGKPVTAQALERAGLAMLKDGQALRGSDFARDIAPGGARAHLIKDHAEQVASEFPDQRRSGPPVATKPGRGALAAGGAALRPSHLPLSPSGGPATVAKPVPPPVAVKPSLASKPGIGQPAAATTSSTSSRAEKELIYADLDIAHLERGRAALGPRAARPTAAATAKPALDDDEPVEYRSIVGTPPDEHEDYQNVPSRRSPPDEHGDYQNVPSRRLPPNRLAPLRGSAAEDAPPALPPRGPRSPSPQAAEMPRSPLSPASSDVSWGSSNFSSGRASPASPATAKSADPMSAPAADFQKMRRISRRLSTRWAQRADAPLSPRSGSPTGESGPLASLQKTWGNPKTAEGRLLADFAQNATVGFLKDAKAGWLKPLKKADTYGAGAAAKEVRHSAEQSAELARRMLGAGADLDAAVEDNETLTRQLLTSVFDQQFTRLGTAQQEKWLKRCEARGEVSRQITQLQARSEKLMSQGDGADAGSTTADHIQSTWLAMGALLAMKEVAKQHSTATA